MKKIIKNNLKVVIAFIIGIVISGLTVSAATILYNSDQVSFDSQYEEFTATNVKEAIDTLYNKSKYLDSISSATCISGTYYHTANTQWNINIGWVPSKFMINLKINNNEYNYTYDKTNFPNRVFSTVYNYSMNTWSGANAYSNFNISTTLTSNFPTTTGTVYQNAYNVNYTFCK